MSKVLPSKWIHAMILVHRCTTVDTISITVGERYRMQKNNICKGHSRHIICSVLAFAMCIALLIAPGESMRVEAKKASKKTPTQTQKVVSEPNELSIAEESALQLINKERAAAGCTALTWSNDLFVAANVRAIEIVQSFSHTRPNGTDYWTVNSDIMYGENLARFYQSADKAMESLMKSNVHKSIFLDGEYKTIGIAICPDQNGKWYWAFELGY